MILGDLQKLINDGHLKKTYIYTSEEGDYEFTFKTLTPIEEVFAERDAKEYYTRDKIIRESDILVYRVNEILARALLSVNGVPAQNVPGTEGHTDLDKKRFLVQRFNQKIALALWTEYNELLQSIIPQNTLIEEEQVKKP